MFLESGENMTDINITQREIENKLFNFIEEKFGKKKYEIYNDVINFVEDEVISTLSEYDEIDVDELEADNEELQSEVESATDAFNSLKEECLDVLNEIDSKLDNLDDLDSEEETQIDKIREFVHSRYRLIDSSDIDY